MRAFVFLLVLANLLFFAYAQGHFGQPVSPDAGRAAQQVDPERIHIVARGEPPLSVAAKPSESCLLWSGLIAADADRLARLVAERAPAARLTRRAEETTSTAWWVFIPPLPSKADADRKAAELKNIGVTDFFIVQDAGPNRLAVSLGVFATEAAATAHLESLRGKGVRTARSGPKGEVEPHLAVEVRGAEGQLAGLREALGEHTAAACPASPAAAVAGAPASQ